MSHNGFGPYGGYSDPSVPRDDSFGAAVEAGLNTHVFHAALDAAENPQWQQVTDHAGNPLFYGDGSPMMTQVPIEQRLAPVVRRSNLVMQLVRTAIPVLGGSGLITYFWFATDHSSAAVTAVGGLLFGGVFLFSLLYTVILLTSLLSRR